MTFQQINPKRSIQGQLFGRPIPPEKAQVLFMPAPWSASCIDVNTVLGPEAILRSSYQVGRSSNHYSNAWNIKMAMLPMPYGWKLKSNQLSHSAKTYLQAWQAGSEIMNRQLTARLDQYSLAFKDRIKSKALLYMEQGKMIGLVGGEQTCALGLIEACTEHHESFGILHIDAHADLRKSYQGLAYSHASIIYHALQLPQVKLLTQVALRNYCEEETEFIQRAGSTIASFSDDTLKSALYQGASWQEICERIVSTLPEKVYISFDIDGLDPKLCPSTARPVPGGLELHQATYLIDQIVASQKRIIAFDLSEVAFNGDTEWDALVGGHLLYHLGTSMARSQQK